MSLDYIRRHYGVPAEIGRRVRIDGRDGVIAEDLMGHPYIGVLMDGDPPNRIMPYHPTNMVEYLDIGPVRRMSRSQQRYHSYLKVADCFDGFRDYLRRTSSREWREMPKP